MTFPESHSLGDQGPENTVHLNQSGSGPGDTQLVRWDSCSNWSLRRSPCKWVLHLPVVFACTSLCPSELSSVTPVSNLLPVILRGQRPFEYNGLPFSTLFSLLQCLCFSRLLLDCFLLHRNLVLLYSASPPDNFKLSQARGTFPLVPAHLQFFPILKSSLN